MQVQGETPAHGPGGIYYVDVLERKASLLESLFPSIRDGSTLVPSSALRTPGVSEGAQHRSDVQAMSISQEVGAAVALRQLGYRVAVHPIGVLVASVGPDTPAAGKLALGDLIVSVDGQQVRTPGDLRRRITRHRPGERVTLGIRTTSGERRVTLRTITGRNPPRAIIGIAPEQAVRVVLPVRVRIDLGEVSGPSAGLAFALEVMEKLGRDVDRGYRVAATGTLALDGTVGPIGGVKQKILGAREASVDIFLAPAGDNATEARQHAGRIRVIPVHTFRQALQALATLPRRR